MLLYVDLGKLEDEPYRLSKIYDTLGQYIDDIRRQRDIIYISKMAESLDISSLDRYRAQLVDEYDRLGTLKKILDEAYDLYKECNEKFEASGQTLCNLYAETPWYETSEGKLAIGIGVLVVTAAVAIVCPAVLGAAAATVTQSIATSALVGSAISGIMNGAASVKAGKSFFDGFASGVEEGAIIGTATYIYHENKYDKAITGGDVAKTWAECAITSFVLRSVFEGGKSSSKADGKNRGMSTSKGRVESESSITCETSYGKSREIIQCNTKDAAADELAKRIGGQSRSAFADDPIQREFDVISDQYIAQAKPPLKCVNKTVRTQMKATFEAAKKYERKIYYQFEGIPSQEVLDKLYEHSERYGVEVIIDTEPLGILN